MSGSNRNFAIAYAFLVILPLIGLAGILKAGRSVTAPISIEGLWTLKVDSPQLDSLPCGKVLGAVPEKTIAIAQSGKTFVLTFPSGPKVIASGMIEGMSLNASLVWPIESSDSNCTGGSQLAVLAQLDRKTDAASLTGILTAPGCPSCSAVEFRAERQPQASTSKGGH
ncbi:MAG: hypothetical protein WAL56_21410 [Candidatus Sulfotelmatobacter sp.]